MRAVRTLLLGLVPLIALSCSSVAPVKVNAGDQCFRCRRTIGDPRVAGEMIDGGLVTKYRGSGCLAKYLVAHPGETGTIFVTDFTTGRMISPTKAMYVPVLLDRNTGDSDYRAYARKTDAEAAAHETNTAAVDWNTVLDKAR